MMTIFTPTYNPPRGFETAVCSCFFTDTAFYQSDFEAVIASRDDLRIWSDSDWPEDNFTAEVNRHELQYHVDDNASHEAYGYMLYDPTRTRCYGSLYVNPMGNLLDDYVLVEGAEDGLTQLDARVDCWLGTDCPDQHRPLSEAIYEWITEQWNIHPGFTVRDRAQARIELYESLGMKRSHSLRSRETGTTLYLYG